MFTIVQLQLLKSTVALNIALSHLLLFKMLDLLWDT